MLCNAHNENKRATIHRVSAYLLFLFFYIIVIVWFDFGIGLMLGLDLG